MTENEKQIQMNEITIAMVERKSSTPFYGLGIRPFEICVWEINGVRMDSASKGRFQLWNLLNKETKTIIDDHPELSWSEALADVVYDTVVHIGIGNRVVEDITRLPSILGEMVHACEAVIETADYTSLHSIAKEIPSVDGRTVLFPFPIDIKKNTTRLLLAACNGMHAYVIPPHIQRQFEIMEFDDYTREGLWTYVPRTRDTHPDDLTMHIGSSNDEQDDPFNVYNDWDGWVVRADPNNYRNIRLAELNTQFFIDVETQPLFTQYSMKKSTGRFADADKIPKLIEFAHDFQSGKHEDRTCCRRNCRRPVRHITRHEWFNIHDKDNDYIRDWHQYCEECFQWRAGQILLRRSTNNENSSYANINRERKLCPQPCCTSKKDGGRSGLIFKKDGKIRVETHSNHKPHFWLGTKNMNSISEYTDEHRARIVIKDAKKLSRLFMLDRFAPNWIEDGGIPDWIIKIAADYGVIGEAIGRADIHISNPFSDEFDASPTNARAVWLGYCKTCGNHNLTPTLPGEKDYEGHSYRELFYRNLLQFIGELVYEDQHQRIKDYKTRQTQRAVDKESYEKREAKRAERRKATSININEVRETVASGGSFGLAELDELLNKGGLSGIAMIEEDEDI
jgi:hypothetical protein